VSTEVRSITVTSENHLRGKTISGLDNTPPPPQDIANLHRNYVLLGNRFLKQIPLFFYFLFAFYLQVPYLFHIFLLFTSHPSILSMFSCAPGRSACECRTTGRVGEISAASTNEEKKIIYIYKSSHQYNG
jgi:hypothetical protein